MEKCTFDNRPDLIAEEGNVTRINFDIEETQQEVQPMGGGEPATRTVFKAYVVRIEQPLTHDKIVDAIITAGYPIDKMQAVQNNYLATPDDPERKAEFDAMQAWRNKAKQVASEVIK